MAMRRAEEARDQRRKWGLYPSKDIDVPTALHLFEWSHYRFARSTEALKADLIQRVLDALRRERPNDPHVHFLHVAVDATQLEATWRVAVNALKQFDAQYSWGSKEKRTRLMSVAKDERLLAALQSACVACQQVPLEFLAVLVLDGSETSTDAVLPHFDRAMRDPHTLESLGRLATFAKGNPAFAPMLAELDRRARAQAAASQTRALAERLGIAGPKRFRVELRMEGTPRANVWCTVELDSDAADDFKVLISTGVGQQASSTLLSTKGLERDDLELGATTLAELPRWLQRAQGELGLKWNRTTARASYLSGARLETFLAWVFGA